nr:putative ribonuclease H-like domain, reverse transcriptase, RNA-dependent DNA polymerase [Tanacetum cinerariifolium]
MVSTNFKTFPTVDSKVSTAKSTFTVGLGNKGKVVKASACWIWRPKQNTTEDGPNSNSISVIFKKYQYINTQSRLKSDSGCSRHMTGNISYLFEYELYDGGYVSFGNRGGKITGKGTKEVASQDVKKDILANVAAPESSGNSNPTATSKNPPANQMETLTVESVIPTVSSPVSTACLDDSPETSSDTRLISKRVTSQDDTPSLEILQFVKQMDVKSAFLYGTIDEEVYVMQPPGFQDPEFSDRVYKVEMAMYGVIRLLEPDLHLYRSMIGSLMYLTASRPDIMFVICAYARHQVTPKECHLHAVKRIFRYLKGHPKLGLWYPKESLFNLVAYSNSNYGGAT